MMPNIKRADCDRKKRQGIIKLSSSLCFSGEYSCLKVDLLFKREFSYYLIQIYTPCCMLVIVSWVSFWLDQGAVPARVSLGVTTLLTMATQTSGINASLPPVSYTKAIDVWTGVCLTFVFGALLEFALVNYASRSGQQKQIIFFIWVPCLFSFSPFISLKYLNQKLTFTKAVRLNSLLHT